MPIQIGRLSRSMGVLSSEAYRGAGSVPRPARQQRQCRQHCGAAAVRAVRRVASRLVQWRGECAHLFEGRRLHRWPLCVLTARTRTSLAPLAPIRLGRAASLMQQRLRETRLPSEPESERVLSCQGCFWRSKLQGGWRTLWAKGEATSRTSCRLHERLVRGAPSCATPTASCPGRAISRVATGSSLWCSAHGWQRQYAHAGAA